MNSVYRSLCVENNWIKFLTATGVNLRKPATIESLLQVFVNIAAWLERLVGLDAPAHILAAVQQILAGEQQQKGKFIFPFNFLTID